MRTRLFISMLLVALLGTLALSAGFAGAQTTGNYGSQQGGAQVSNNNPGPGGSITVSGQGFAPGTKVRIVLGEVLLRTVTVTAGGTVSARVTIPCGTAAGANTISLQGTAPGGATRTLTADITVAGGTCALPKTGSSNTAPLAASGVGLVLLGGVAVIVARRRRQSVSV